MKPYLAFVLGCFRLVLIAKGREEKHVHTNCTKPGLFALTFDDGPSVGRTDAILDVLKLNNVTATFFVCGQTYADLNTPEPQALLRRIVAEGHQIGVHSWSHKVLSEQWRQAPEIRMEVKSVVDKVYEITGVNTTIMRPPYGAYNETIVDIVYGEFGHEIIMWNIDTEDYKHPSDTVAGIQGYIDGTTNSSSITHSFIALHHDPLVGGGTLAQSAILFMKNRNYTFVTIDECLGKSKKMNYLYGNESIQQGCF